MRIALELNGTECQSLIELLNNKIAEDEVYRETHKELWSYKEAAILYGRVKLRDKIQKFQDIQEHLR